MEYPSSKGIVSSLLLANMLMIISSSNSGLHLPLVWDIFANLISKFDVLKLERALEVERMSNLELQKKITTLRNQPTASVEPTENRGA